MYTRPGRILLATKDEKIPKTDATYDVKPMQRKTLFIWKHSKIYHEYKVEIYPDIQSKIMFTKDNLNDEIGCVSTLDSPRLMTCFTCFTYSIYIRRITNILHKKANWFGGQELDLGQEGVLYTS
ncbi:hypothetical protein EYC80_004975 [Monilinia laxa]|uniref:Uncharacterized protein n=1 Tax=Monilinia laxa TaxID=61186 RepID=A0A5N6KIH1_MONLA|nr:hypothetical protein EYC80_004975 [Monilinia laxa]